MLSAAKSHLAESSWCVIFREPETKTRSLLECIARTPELYWSYISNFWIAEVDGVAAAAMCAFAPAVENSLNLEGVELRVVQQASGYSEERLAGVSKRLSIAALGLPGELPNAWGIENVAVLPEFRGKGVIDRLFEHVLEEGRMKGFKHAQIICLIGNEQGQHAFERNGFQVMLQKTNPDFEGLFGTAGAKLLVQNI